uniref:ANK_REP_REGION domain-containing protein n=1 Tax=Steinernema glaseri TaxID=37863 RepID=A0A1I8A329_9BILA
MESDAFQLEWFSEMYTIALRHCGDNNRVTTAMVREGEYVDGLDHISSQFHKAMSSQSSSGTCLVARAAPCAIPQEPTTERLTDALKGLTIKEAPVNKPKKYARNVDGISPSDYVSLQSLRSSALARKTNTTSKFVRDGANLFSDLLDANLPAPKIEDTKAETEKKEENEPKEETVKEEPVKEEVKKEEETKEQEESSDKNKEETKEESEESKTDAETEAELLSRGPVRTSRQTAYNNAHPYNGNNRYPFTNGQSQEYGSYSNPYETECQNWWNSENPGYSPQSDAGYYSPQRHSPFTADHGLSSAELSRLLSAKDEAELPDALSDFILKYSRRYSSSTPDAKENRQRKDSFSDSTAGSPSHQRPPSTDSGCGSPMSAGSAPQRSPAAPRGGICCPMTPGVEQRYQSQTSELFGPMVRSEPGARPAKTRLRSMISDTDMDVAWAWTCKCVQYIPGALYYQDPDRDTLLHIVIAHLDIPKVYALVEQMLKMEFPSCQKPFDIPNSSNETPLFLAVESRRTELVDYLIEAGADPNIQTSRPERDAPLHYAAARGMTPIVQILSSYPSTNINLTNGMGLTPLLCAVKNHGVMEEQSQCVLDNKTTIRALLEAGADPSIADATNGKTVIHYAAERLDAELVEIFRELLNEEKMTLLVNQPDLSRETPIESLPASSNSQLRSNIFVALVSCGATMRSPMNS